MGTLPDLITHSGQQRNVVLHLSLLMASMVCTHARKMVLSVSVLVGVWVGVWLVDMTHAEIKIEMIVDEKVYHTIKEVKNGQGPAP